MSFRHGFGGPAPLRIVKPASALAPTPTPAGPTTTCPTVEPPRFDAVYDEHFAYLWSCLRRLGVPAASIDDAVQDVFVVVHRRLADFEGRSSLRTWLFGIALRVARDYRRRAERTEPGGEGPERTAPDTVRPSPFEDAAAAEGARLLDRLLGQLEESRREVFVLAELEQMTAPEIASCLEVNLNTVYARLRAARAEFERAVARLQASRERETR